MQACRLQFRFSGVLIWCPPLYFLSGADIFDGLTWLLLFHGRLGRILDECGKYQIEGIRINDDDIDPMIWFSNYQEIINLQISMNRYLKEGNFSCFKKNEGRVELAYKELLASRKLKGD